MVRLSFLIFFIFEEFLEFNFRKGDITEVLDAKLKFMTL